MSPSELKSLLADLAPDLAVMDEEWVIIGSASLMIRGLPIGDCPDVDIMTTPEGAAVLEARWARWRRTDYRPDSSGYFQSRFSRYDLRGHAFEVLGGLATRLEEGWGPVVIDEVESVRFGKAQLRIPSAKDQLRILRQFGRPKDLRRADMLEAWLPCAGQVEFSAQFL
jgi:hypothetical protein